MPFERKFKNMQHHHHQPQPQPPPPPAVPPYLQTQHLLQQAQPNGVRPLGMYGMTLPPMNPYAAVLPQQTHQVMGGGVSFDPPLVNLLQRLQLNVSLQNGFLPLYDAALLNLLTLDAVPPPVRFVPGGQPPTLSYLPNMLDPALHSNACALPPLGVGIGAGIGAGYNGVFNVDLMLAISRLSEQERQALLQLAQFSTQSALSALVASNLSQKSNNINSQLAVEMGPGLPHGVTDPKPTTNPSYSVSSGLGSAGSSCSFSSDSIDPSPREPPLPSTSCCDISPPLYLQDQENQPQPQQQQQQQPLEYVCNPPAVDPLQEQMDDYQKIDETPIDSVVEPQTFGNASNQLALQQCWGSYSYHHADMHHHQQQQQQQQQQLLSLPQGDGDFKQYENYIKIRNTRVKGYNRRVYFNGVDYVFDNDEMPPPGEKRTYLLLSDNALNAEKHIKPALPGTSSAAWNFFPSMRDNGGLLPLGHRHEYIDGAGDSTLIRRSQPRELATFTVPITVERSESAELDAARAMQDSSSEWPPLPRPQLLNFSGGFPDENVGGTIEVKGSRNNVPKKQKPGAQKNGRKNWRCISTDIP